MSNTYILAIDQSTSGTKVLLVDKDGEIIYKKNKEHQQFYPQPGWVEHDPIEIMDNVWELTQSAIKQLKDGDSIVSLAITNQRETALIWDEQTGLPIYNAIVWQCRRTTALCEKIISEGHESRIQDKTGLRVDPYFSASKFKWILNHVEETVEGTKEKLENGQLLAGTIDSWLIWNLTSRTSYRTDITNASRTLLFNIYDLTWDNELVKVFGLEKLRLPHVSMCNDFFGTTDLQGALSSPIPITGVIGDSQGALFAQGCNVKGTAKATYGTGTSIMMYTGNKPISSKNGLVTAIAWGLDGHVEYAFEGVINCSGDTLNWLKNELGLFENHDEIEALATSIRSNEGVYLVPALVGYGIPYWNPNAKAAIVGMTRGTTKAHLVRAGVESIVYQIHDAIKTMEEVSHIKLESLKVDGGATTNQFLVQFQADILAKTVVVSETKELSAMGAVYISGLKIGLWDTLETISQQSYTQIVPKMDEITRQNNLIHWKKAVEMIVCI